MFKYYLTHSTHYKYSNHIQENTNRICLYPYNDMIQQLVSHKLEITGNPNVAHPSAEDEAGPPFAVRCS